MVADADVVAGGVGSGTPPLPWLIFPMGRPGSWNLSNFPRT
jgi:hypothetical protein